MANRAGREGRNRSIVPFDRILHDDHDPVTCECCHAEVPRGKGYSSFCLTPFHARVKERRRFQVPNYLPLRLYALNVMTSPQTSNTPSKTMNTVVGVFAEPR
jgi:hypothetical protein